MNPPRPPPAPPPGAGAFFLVDMPPSLIEMVSPSLREKSRAGWAGAEEGEDDEEEEEEGVARILGGFCRFDQSADGGSRVRTSSCGSDDS